MLQPPCINRIAIIGAGPGGLAAARALRDEKAFENITVLERNEKLGGIWRYSEKTATPSHIPSTDALVVEPPDQPISPGPQISPIYNYAYTNLPKTVMAYRDIPFPDSCPLFLNRFQVLEYIENMAKDHNLLSMVRFNTTVVKVEPLPDATWRVHVTERTVDNETSYTELFDAIIVASGHFYVPYLPEIEGIQNFAQVPEHHVIHSLEYRHPKVFTGKTVLIVGKGNSAFDLVREISTEAKKVYHCVQGDDNLFTLVLAGRMPKNAYRIGAIAKFGRDEIECQDGKRINDVDTVIFATGYLYSFPFLPFEGDTLIVDGQKVHNLFEYMFYVENPTLSFLGLPIRVAQFPLMQLQSTVIARCYSGKIQLPPQRAMKEAIASETNDRNEFIMDVETEIAYFDRLGAWAEGYKGNIEDWNSSDPITGRLSEKWRQVRSNTLELLQEFIGSRFI
ncbi:hypothetical protein BJV82DRAFT_504277 [Fennellomyces sp. T-0311]|nr:hypothetical protein BJV82DRAFT_504277 [Fennellomyces sp. T-0311]